jgi:hypothetical protein
MIYSILAFIVWHTSVGVSFVADLRPVIRPTGTDNWA